jgi:drug/metabolite transporter (DMT)-like permease
VPYLAFLFICLCWGSSFILMDRASLAFGPVAVGMWRMIGGAATLALYALIRGQRTWISAAEWRHVLVVAVLSNALPYAIQPYVMHRAGEHGFFGLMVTLVPLSTIAASALMLRTWPTPRQWLGVLGGLACIAAIGYDGLRRGFTPGMLALALSTPVAYAFGNTYLKWRLNHLPPAPLSAAFLGLGAALLAPLEFIPGLAERFGLAGPTVPREWPLAVGSLAALGVLSTGLAILMFVHLIQTQGPLFAGMTTYVIPIIALAWGQLDGERLTGLQLAAIAGVLAMVALVQWGAASDPSAAASSPT